jgi:hypothetical protein
MTGGSAMQDRGTSSRRSFVSLGGVLCVGLVLALSAAGAAGKTRLPDGARFQKSLGAGHSLTVGVGAEGVSVTLSGVPIRCTKHESTQGREAHVGLGLAAPERPEVGRSYKLTKTKTRTRSEGKGGGTSSSTTEVTLDFKSAKQVLVRIHQVTSTDGEAGCDGSATYTVKRQT